MSRNDKASIQIGMPVFNGSKFVGEALNSIMAQSFQDWRLIIADNNSTDSTEEICRGYARQDSRISYVRHSSNIGAPKNFEFVLHQADTPYFMWAAADDIWGPGFIESCISRLENNPKYGMAFTGLDVIDSFGQVVRHCPDIPSFSGTADLLTIARYVWSPEFHGKANLIYSVFRTELCKTAHSRFSFTLDWGGDMCFNLAAMSIGGIDIIEEIHFFKRDSRNTDQLGSPRPIFMPKSLVERSCPIQYFPAYTEDLLKAVHGTHFYAAVYSVMKVREWRLRYLVRSDRIG